MSPVEIAARAGYVFQNPEHQFVAATVRQEVAYSLVMQGLPADVVRLRTEAMLADFRLTGFADTSPHALSAGEMRRLSVATMLVVGPEILILDEPTFGLDRRNSQTIMSLLMVLHDNGKTIIMVTHDMRLVAEYADTVVVMANGESVFQGCPRDLFQRPDVLAAASLDQPPIWKIGQRADPDARTLTVAELVERVLSGAGFAA
jgi:energy-coupling factor transport system ATP-binding protein